MIFAILQVEVSTSAHGQAKLCPLMNVRNQSSYETLCTSSVQKLSKQLVHNFTSSSIINDITLDYSVFVDVVVN